MKMGETHRKKREEKQFNNKESKRSSEMGNRSNTCMQQTGRQNMQIHFRQNETKNKQEKKKQQHTNTECSNKIGYCISTPVVVQHYPSLL